MTPRLIPGPPARIGRDRTATRRYLVFCSQPLRAEMLADKIMVERFRRDSECTSHLAATDLHRAECPIVTHVPHRLRVHAEDGCGLLHGNVAHGAFPSSTAMENLACA